jgi:hypothetical protein
VLSNFRFTRKRTSPKHYRHVQVTVDVGFAYHETIQDVLRVIRKHKGKIVDFDPDGPAGGNPNVLLGFETKDAALRFHKERYPDDDHEFNPSRIEKAEA